MANLVGISDIHTYLGLSSGDGKDDVLSAISERVSAAVRRYTGRPFEPTRYYEWHDGEGHDSIFLRRAPVNVVNTLSEGGEEVSAEDYDVYAEEAVLRRAGGAWPEGVRNIYVDYEAGEDEAPADVKQAALDWIKAIYDARGITGAGIAESERIGDYAVTYRANAPTAAEMPAGVKAILDLHRFLDLGAA